MKIKVIAYILLMLMLISSCTQSPLQEPKNESTSDQSSTKESSETPTSISSLPDTSEVSSSEVESQEQQSAQIPNTSSSVQQSTEVSETTVNNTSYSEESKTETSSTSAEKNSWIIKNDESYELYLYCPDQVSYKQLESYCFAPSEQDYGPIIVALNELPALTKIETKPSGNVIAGFLIIRDNYQKTEFFIYKNGLEVNGTLYDLPDEQYKNLVKLADAEKPKQNDPVLSAQWLVWMNPNRVTSIEYTDQAGNTSQINQNILLVAMEPRYLNFSTGTTYTPGSKNFDSMNKKFQTKMTFDNGVTYTMVSDNENMYLESSDMDFACQYKVWNANIDSYISFMDRAKDGQANPRTGKPVIYLYPKKETQVSVNLKFDGDLTYTYPTYNNGWSVTAYPDGTIVNKSDSSEHRYLFWEGITPHKWNLETGFVVKGNETEKFLREKLAYLGLTPFEYNDFITYWVPQMQDNAYNIISFSSLEEYAEIAKLDISPKPDSILRVHMAWKAIDHPINLPEQQLTQFVRTGFTVVEWGGTEVK